MKLKLINFVILTALVQLLHAQVSAKDSVSVILSMPRKDISSSGDLKINVLITSYKKDILEVPIQDEWGYIKYHGGFLAIQVQRQLNEKFIDIPELKRIDSYPAVDIDTLRSNESKSWPFNLTRTYDFTKGNYRIKVLARLSTLNHTGDIYSRWVYFSCLNDIQ